MISPEPPACKSHLAVPNAPLVSNCTRVTRSRHHGIQCMLWTFMCRNAREVMGPTDIMSRGWRKTLKEYEP